MQLPTQYQSYIHTSKYARWLEKEKRRETWEETVDRYMDNVINPALLKVYGEATEDYHRVSNDIRDAILTLKIMPSMRALMTAGPALDRDNVAGFNCSYLAVNYVRAFDEAMYILLCGTGVGFSVEQNEVSQLPTIPQEMFVVDDTIVVEDSKEGWATAQKELIAFLYDGKIPNWDTKKVRPAGAKLKTFGGRASGPGPLVDLFRFTVNLFVNAKGRKLTSIECHDLMCKTGEIVVVGGVRRSAMISLSDLSDNKLRQAKSGSWWENTGYRALANNSVAYGDKPDIVTFMQEWLSLIESKSGERGIFNREAAKKKVRENDRRSDDYNFGTNPCGEIILRPKQFCNLAEVVVRSEDTLDTLVEKVRLATILGTIQATLTYFPYLSEEWKKNTEEECLLGVSLTGVMDNKYMSVPGWQLEAILSHLKEVSVETNKEWAEKLGINQSTAITCNKPSGTVSQLVDSASGIHTRHSDYYIRTVRGDNKDPLTLFMKEQGIPFEPCVMQPTTTTVFSFPVAAPEGSLTRDSLTAIEQLELWSAYQTYWCEHNPSVTVTVRDSEWLEVGAWVYKNFDKVCGVSFLPHSDHIYQQAPYQEIDRDTYYKLVSEMPKDLDWSGLSVYEKKDTTKSSQMFACVGNCEIVDVSG